MTALQVRQTVLELAQNNNDVKEAWQARISRALVIIGDYELALLTGKQNILIMNVMLTKDAWFSFLAIEADGKEGWHLNWRQKLAFNRRTR